VYRVKAVCIFAFSQCYFKFGPFIFKDNQTLWQTAENYDGSINALFSKQNRLAFGRCN